MANIIIGIIIGWTFTCLHYDPTFFYDLLNTISHHLSQLGEGFKVSPKDSTPL